MTTIYVTLSTDGASVETYFGSPQDPEIYPNYAEISTSDPRWETFYDAAGYVQKGLPAPPPAA